MFGLTFLLFVALCSEIRSEFSYGSFDTICIPNQACYYVSKFKTNWEDAQQMCQEKIQEYSASFNETDNTVLNPLASDLLTKRYWVLEPRNINVPRKTPQVTVILNRKKRSFTVERSNSLMKTISQVTNWDWPDLLQRTSRSNVQGLSKNIKRVFKFIKSGKALPAYLIPEWNRTYRILYRTRIQRKFRRAYFRWIRLIDEFGTRRIRKIILRLKPKIRLLWNRRIKRIIRRLRSRRYSRLNVKLLALFNKFIYNIELNIRGKEDYIRLLIIRWNKYKKWLDEKNWEELMRFVSVKYKNKIKTTITILLDLLKNKKYNLINFNLIERVRFSTRILKRLWTIHIEHGGLERYRLIIRIRRILRLKWKTILNKLNGIDKVKWVQNFKTIIRLIKDKQYKKIDKNLLLEFKKLITLINKRIKVVRPIENIVIKRLINFVKLLKKWNWPDLIRKLSVKKRDRINQELTNIIQIIKQRKFGKINSKLFNRIKLLVKVVRQLHLQKELTPEIIIRKVNKIIVKLTKWNWPNLVNKLDVKKRDKVTNEIKTIIKLIKEKPNEIDNEILVRIKLISKTLNEVRPQILVKKVNRLVKILTKWNWPELVKKIDVKDRDRVIEEIKTILKLIKERPNEIDNKVLERIKTVYKVINKVRPKKPEIPKVTLKKVKKLVKILTKWNWPELVKKIDEKDRDRVTEEIKTILKLIKERPNEIDNKVLERIKTVYKVINKVRPKKPEIPKVTLKKVKKLVKILTKWNWPELVKKIDEKDRDRVTEEIKTILKLIKERPNEIDNKVLERIKTVYKVINKVRPKEPEEPKIILKKVDRLVKILTKWNWPELVKKIDEKDRDKVTEEIKTIIKLIKEKPDEIDNKVLERIKTVYKVINKVKPTIPSKQEVIRKKVEVFVTLLKKWNWPELVKNIDGQDRERVTEEIKTIIKLIEEKPDEVDNKVLERIKKIHKVIEKVRPQEPIKSEKIIKKVNKLINILTKWNWPQLIKKLNEKDRDRIREEMTNIIKIIQEQPNEIDQKVLDRITIVYKIIKDIEDSKIPTDLEPSKKNLTSITEKALIYVSVLNQLKWKELVKYIDSKNRPTVVNKVETFLNLVENKNFDKIDPYLINFITRIIKSFKKITDINERNEIKEKNLKLITKTATENVRILNELKWPDLVKYFEEKTRPEIVDRIKSFIKLVENQQFSKIDNSLINWIVDVIEKLKKANQVPDTELLQKEKDKKLIIDNSANLVKTLNELNWEILTNYIQESQRPETIEKIKTFITLVNNKEFDKIDTFTYNWITKIISTFNEVKKINDENKKIEEQNKKALVETSIKSLEYLQQLKWEELVKYIDENKREDFVKKIKLFIELVKTKQFDKIDINLLSWITDTIDTLNKVKIVPPIDEVHKDKITPEVKTKFSKDLIDLKWEELVQKIDAKDRPTIENQIKTFISLVENKKFDKIDNDSIKTITETITLLTKIRDMDRLNKQAEENTKNALIDLATKSFNALNELKWEELMPYIDDKSRPEIVESIKKFVESVENKKFDTIDTNRLEWINKIILTLRNIRKVNIENEIKEKNNREIITNMATKNFNLLKEINWEDLVKFVDEKNRPTVVEKIKNFLVLMENKQLDKIDIDLTNWITEIVSTLRKVKEINEINNENEAKRIKITTDVSGKYIESLNELKWPDLVKFIDESNRPEVINKIKTFITFVENKQFDKIDNYLLSWIKEIIATLRKVNEINVINKVTDENNKQIIKTTSINYVTILKKLKWEDLTKGIAEPQRPEVIAKIKEFITNVEQKQFDNINVDALNYMTKIIEVLERLRRTSVGSEGTSKIQLSLPDNWEELVKRIKDIDHNLWIGRIQQLLASSSSKEYKNVDFDWIEELQKIIQLISQEHQKYKKETFLNEESIAKIKANVRLLDEWKWETYLKYIDEKNRQQVSDAVKQMSSACSSGNFEQLDAQFVKWFDDIVAIFTQINEAIKNGYEYDLSTKTWVKTVDKKAERKKRSTTNEDNLLQSAQINVGLLTRSISDLQKALSYNQMLLEQGHQEKSYSTQDRSQMCPFINVVNNKLVTKETNCQIKQRFICKRQMN